MAMKSISVRMDGDLLDKMHVVAAAEQHSGNGYIVHLIMRNVEAYEQKHGPIELPVRRNNGRGKA